MLVATVSSSFFTVSPVKSPNFQVENSSGKVELSEEGFECKQVLANEKASIFKFNPLTSPV